MAKAAETDQHRLATQFSLRTLLMGWLLVAVFFGGRHVGEQSMIRRLRNVEALNQLERTKLWRAEATARRKVRVANASVQIYRKRYEDLTLRLWKLETEYEKLKSTLNRDTLDLPVHIDT